MPARGSASGLRTAAQKKKQLALERTNKTIDEMVTSGKTINFHTVAEAANVSVAYLYKNDELKQRIDQLRKQHSPIKGLPNQARSDNSKTAIITTLTERIKKLEAENKGLRHQNEVAYGMTSQFAQLQQQITVLQAENLTLKEQLNAYLTDKSELLLNSKISCLTENKQDKKVTQPRIDSRIQSDLAELKITLNSTLTKTIRAASVELVLGAIEALKEAMASGNVSTPGGWLNKAIQEGWIPNEKHIHKLEQEIFNEWFNLARIQGLIMASMKGDDDKLYVFSKDGLRLPFEQMIAEYPIDVLRKRGESSTLRHK